METILCPVREAARRAPNVVAIDARRRHLTYADLDALADLCAYTLDNAGISPGCRVALYVEDRVEMLALILGVMRSGRVACLLSTRLPLQSAATLARRTACEILVGDDPEAFAEFLPEMKRLAVATFWAQPPVPVRRTSIVLPVDQPATVVYTSGSTGEPKAALHSVGNHYYSALGANANVVLLSGNRWLLSLPLYHVGGLGIVFRCITAGATIVVAEPGQSITEALEHRSITHVSMVPTQLYRYLNERREPMLDRLQAVVLGGGPSAGALVEEAVREQVPVFTTWGMTETSSMVTCSPALMRGVMPIGSGRVLPFRRLLIDRTGEILVRGKTLFKGYIQGDRVEPSVDDDGWFHTGDIGMLDDEGNLFIEGRLDNQFISGGENIQPEEIEREIARSQMVAQVIVVPVEDQEFGQRPVAFVRWTPNAGVEGREERLRRVLEQAIPRFKIPTAFFSWPEQAGSSELKPSRAVLQRLAAELTANDRAEARK